MRSVISVKTDFLGTMPLFILRVADFGLANFLLGLLVFSYSKKCIYLNGYRYFFNDINIIKFDLKVKITLTEQLLVIIRLLRLTTCDIGLEGIVICCVPKLFMLLVFPDWLNTGFELY